MEIKEYIEKNGDLPEEVKSQAVRVACVSMPRIRSSAGEIMLLVNKNRLSKKGEVSLNFPGGAYAVKGYPEGEKFILSLSEKIEPMSKEVTERFWEEEEFTLRFYIQGGKFKQVYDWFKLRKGREIVPDREITEELTKETNLLEHVTIKSEFIGMIINTEVSSRAGSNKDLINIRLWEIFDVFLAPKEIRILEKKANRFVSSISRNRIVQEYKNIVTKTEHMNEPFRFSTIDTYMSKYLRPVFVDAKDIERKTTSNGIPITKSVNHKDSGAVSGSIKEDDFIRQIFLFGK